MASEARILAFAGSTRRESYNKRLVKIAAEGAKEAGGIVSVIDLSDFPLPLFDEDLEASQGPPESALRLKTLMTSHDGFLIASAEYNSSLSAVLKNAIDWVSRSASGEPPLMAYNGKVATILSASPGGLGGLRGLVHLRSILGNLGVLVLPNQVAIPRAFEAFDAEGRLIDPNRQASVAQLGATLVRTVVKLRS